VLIYRLLKEVSGAYTAMKRYDHIYQKKWLEDKEKAIKEGNRRH
jgi:hypothetical protein